MLMYWSRCTSPIAIPFVHFSFLLFEAATTLNLKQKDIRNGAQMPANEFNDDDVCAIHTHAHANKSERET